MHRFLPLSGLALLIASCGSNETTPETSNESSSENDTKTQASEDPTTAPSSEDPATQPSKPEPTEFARFRRLNEDDALFETAIVRYRNADGAHVSLIASVHIADKAHFEELNEEFEKYDALLYELVAPEGFRPEKGLVRKADNPLSFLQLAMKKGLELEFQLGSIDYTPDHFVHADLTPEGFQQAMEDRGESILSIVFEMIANQGKFAEQMRDDPSKEPTKFDIVSAFRNKEGRHTLRLMVAEQLTMLENMAAGVDPESDENGDGTVLLEGRNDPRARSPARTTRRRQARDRDLLRRRAHAGHREEAHPRLRLREGVRAQCSSRGTSPSASTASANRSDLVGPQATKKAPRFAARGSWSLRRELNSRPTHYECVALPLSYSGRLWGGRT